MSAFQEGTESDIHSMTWNHINVGGKFNFDLKKIVVCKSKLLQTYFHVMFIEIIKHCYEGSCTTMF